MMPLATLYCTIQMDTHLHFIMEYCDGRGRLRTRTPEWRLTGWDG